MFANRQEYSKSFVYSVLLSIAILIINIGVAYFVQEGNFKTILIDLGASLWYTLAALALFCAALRCAAHSRRLAWAWAVLGLAELSLAIGSANWVYLEIFVHPIPFLSLSDVFYIAFYPLYLLGILLFPAKHLSWNDWVKAGLDMAVVLLTASLVLSHYWLNPLLDQVWDDSFVLQFVSLAYPVGDLVLFAGLLLLLYRQVLGQPKEPLYLLAVGIVMMIVADVNYGYQGLLSNATSGTWLDLGWGLSALSHGIAGIWLVTNTQWAQSTPFVTPPIDPTLTDAAIPAKLNSWATYLPYGCAIAAYLIQQQIESQRGQAEFVWGSWPVGFIIMLVLLRQMMTLRENSVLFGNLRKKEEALSEANQELRQTQAMLIHAEKMNALGQVVAGVAHEINNPIAFVNSNIHALKQTLPELITAYTELEQLALITNTPEQQTAVAALHKAADIDFLQADLTDLLDTSLSGLARVRKIVQGLRNFSRLDEAEYKLADLREGIESSLLIARSTFTKQIRVDLALDNLPLISCHPAELNQVFLNLLLNAAYAIDGQGVISVTGEETPSEVILTFRDSGCGMPQEVIQQIFHPFFTTKPVGVGTGLGLAIAYQIITIGHQGKIEVASTVGQGTTFTIWLPREHHT